jgi:hypothetical protein
VAAATLAVAAPAGASAKADLAVTKVHAPKAAVRGAPLDATATVRAKGAVSRATTLGFFLSANRTKGKSDKPLIGGALVPKLRGGKSAAGHAIGFLSASTKPGKYFVLACADARQQVKEASEKNNCRASARKVSVRKARAPVKVKPTLASTGAVSQLVNADTGGTLSTTGPDGSTYSLVIPPNGLTGDETITMTPVASIAGLPFKRAVAGVDLQPEGLVLTGLARLTITPKSSPPAGKLVTVGWHAGGEGLHLQPPGREKALVLGIDHFSGSEVVEATPAQVAAQLQRPPIRTHEQLSQAVHDVARDARDALIAGNNTEALKLGENLEPVYQSYYDTTIKDLLTSAETNDLLGRAALTEALQWVHEMQTLSLVASADGSGISPELNTRAHEVLTKLTTIVTNALRRAGERCVAGDIAQVQQIQALERFAQQLGTTGGDALEKAQRCLHFELDYDATWQERQTIADNAPDARGDFTTKIAGLKISAVLTRSIPEPVVTQPLQYGAYSWSSGTCQGSLGSVNEQSPFSVSFLQVTSKLTQTVDSHGRSSFTSGPPEVTMLLDPGQRVENVPYTCSGGGSGTQHNRFFDEGFKVLHATEQLGGQEVQGNLYSITGWQKGTGSTLATKTYNSGPPPATGFRRYAETSTFRLRHTPQP